MGLCLAAAYARHDAGLAADTFRHLRDRRPPTNVLVGASIVPIHELCLFATGCDGAMGTLRTEAFEDALDDARLETLVAAVAAGGADDWLDGHLDHQVATGVPGRIAKALTAESLRAPNAHTERVLGMEWGTGFLGSVAANARKAYERARWAEHWTAASAMATEPADFWRFAFLAEGVADRRLLRSIGGLIAGSRWRRPFGGEFEERLRRAVTQRTAGREKMRCGLAAPAQDLRVLLRDTGDEG